MRIDPKAVDAGALALLKMRQKAASIQPEHLARTLKDICPGYRKILRKESRAVIKATTKEVK